MSRRRRWSAVALVIFALVPGTAWGAEPVPTEPETRSDLGVKLAIRGQTSEAESLFVSLLSDVRGDARALNNLGNLRVVRGELGIALAFYDRALRGDSLDGGIHLNRATALLLMGDSERARDAASRGVALAGGVEKAETLLGIRPDPAAKEARAAERKYISKQEVRSLLAEAAKLVPAPKQKPPARRGTAVEAAKKGSNWRSAATRQADAGEATAVLYWKR